MNREAYKNWDISSATANLLSVAEELNELYKNDVSMPANNFDDFKKGFADSKLFWPLYDYHYSEYEEPESAYVYEFVTSNEMVPYRDTFKKTEVGLHLPEVLSEEKRMPKVGDPLVFKKADNVPVWQDESAPISDWHVFDNIDVHYFDAASKFLTSSDYFTFVTQLMRAMRKGTELVHKAIIDTFLASVLKIWAYPRDHLLFRLFSDEDGFTPDENYSKNAKTFYLKDGEMRKKLKEIQKYVESYYKARAPYLTNLQSTEPVGGVVDGTVPEWNKRKADLSTKEKKLEAVRSWFFNKDDQNKYTQVAYKYRRSSVLALSSQIFNVLDRMTTANYRNWCGHEIGQDNKDKEAYPLACAPSNLLVFVNRADLNDMLNIGLGEVSNPYGTDRVVGRRLEEWTRRGTRIYGCDFILPSMAIVMDKICFQIMQYFNEQYDHFSPVQLVQSMIKHVMLKPVLFRKVACNVIELAKGQKYCLPIGWGSDHLPFLREA